MIVRDPFFPFHALGLRGNPFRALTDDEWADVAILGESFAAALDRDAHVQILGPAGSGKTTALLGAVDRLTRDGRRVAYEYIPAGRHRFTTRTADLDVFALDEAQRLDRWQRWRLLRLLCRSRQSLRLLLATHEDLTPLFARHRLQLATTHADRVAEADLAAILDRRLRRFAIGGESSIAFAPDAVRWLGESFGSDLRRLMHFLYEVFERLTAPGVINSTDLERMSHQLRRGGDA
jgi:replication-associated recombination protein RarA